MTLTQINKAGLDEIALDHVFTIGASGSSAYTFQGEGLNGTVNNPTLYLTRGKTYRFENGSGGHPIRIQSTSGASGTAYNTGVTNNAGSGTVIVEVQHDAPDVLYYQCTSHAAMNGILYITGALADGGVTTAKIANNAVTADKLSNSEVTFAKLQDVSQNRIAGRISSGSGVLQELTAANVRSIINVADGATNSPTTSIINNADNKIITGSGTADTLNAESGLLFDSSQRLLLGNSSSRNVGGSTTNSKFQIEGTSTNTSSISLVNNETNSAAPFIFFGKTRGNSVGESGIVQDGDTLGGLSFIGADGNDTNNRTAEIIAKVDGTPANNTIPTALTFSTSPQHASQLAERMRIDSSGAIMINSTSLSQSKTPKLEVKSDSNSSTDFAATFTSANGSSGIGISYGVIEAFNNTSNPIIQFKTNGADAVRIASNQNVGIGTTNPGQRLEVRQAAASHAIIACNRADSDTFAVALGNTSAGNGVLSVNNADLVFGRDYSGTFTERMRMRNDGGLCFNGDSAAANALDDYEEGTWTPQAASGVSGYTFSNNAGYYRKIGDLVWWFVHTTISLVPNDNNVYEIHGLPYTSAATNHNYGWNANIVYTANSNNTIIANMRPLVQRAASYVYFHRVGVGSSQRVTNSQFRTGLQSETMIMAGNYQAG